MYEATLEGLVAIVTGGGAGIGRCTAKLLAARGARLVVADIDEDAADDVVDEIAAAGGEAVAQTVDMADETQVAALIARSLDAYGRVDILFNNAALTAAAHMARDHDAAALDVEVWDRTMNVNARGVWLGCKHVIPAMIRTGGGSIINSSSDATLRGEMVRTAYAASKAAVTTLSIYVAAQFGRDGIRCNAIRPVALVERPLAIDDEARDAYQAAFALGRTGTAEDIAKVVAFLASPESSWITGTEIPINGGFGLGSAMWPIGRKRYEAGREPPSP